MLPNEFVIITEGQPCYTFMSRKVSHDHCIFLLSIQILNDNMAYAINLKKV